MKNHIKYSILTCATRQIPETLQEAKSKGNLRFARYSARYQITRTNQSSVNCESSKRDAVKARFDLQRR